MSKFACVKGEFNSEFEKLKGVWKIDDFFSLSENKGSNYESPTFTYAQAVWCLRLYAGGIIDSKDGFISLFLVAKSGLPKTVKYSFGFKKVDGKVETICEERVHQFKEVNIGNGCYDFYERSELVRRKSELAPLDTLTIACHLLHGTEWQTTDESIVPTKLIELETLSKNFGDLLSNEKNCDTVLRVKNQEFQVHRSVIVARSSVFAATFQHDMSEKETGVISVEDCDPDSFKDFLQYLYTGIVEDISFQSAFHLFITADKYDVQELKLFCVEFMKHSLTVENVLNVVALAEQYDETGLLAKAQNFFNNNCGEIFVTTEWDALMAKDRRLANKLLIQMSSKGVVND